MTTTKTQTERKQAMKNYKSSWTEEAVKRLANAIKFAYDNQNTYDKPLNLEQRVKGWKFVLSDDYPIEAVFMALKEFMRECKEMPVPADIVKILSPEPPRITEAEFVEAQKWQERNGHPIFSDAKKTIEKYRQQQSDSRKNYKIKSEEIKVILDDSVKKIEKI